MECGQDEIVLDSEGLSVGVNFDFFTSLASLPIVVGDTGVSFILPDDTSNFEKIGEDQVIPHFFFTPKETSHAKHFKKPSFLPSFPHPLPQGSCTPTGTSVVYLGENRQPIASFSFLALDCPEQAEVVDVSDKVFIFDLFFFQKKKISCI